MGHSEIEPGREGHDKHDPKQIQHAVTEALKDLHFLNPAHPKTMPLHSDGSSINFGDHDHLYGSKAIEHGAQEKAHDAPGNTHSSNSGGGGLIGAFSGFVHHTVDTVRHDASHAADDLDLNKPGHALVHSADDLRHDASHVARTGVDAANDAQNAVVHTEDTLIHDEIHVADDLRHNVNTASRFASHEVSSHLTGLTEIAMPELALIDDATHAHLTNAVDDVLRGAANEVIHHPLTVLEDAAIGAAIAVTAVALPGSTVLWGVALGAGLYAGDEVVHHGIKAPLSETTNLKSLGEAAVGWAKDAAIIAGPGKHSAKQEADAQQGLESLGSYGTQLAAGALGGVGGGIGSTAVDLDGALSNAGRAILPRISEVSEETSTTPGGLRLARGTAAVSDKEAPDMEEMMEEELEKEHLKAAPSVVGKTDAEDDNGGPSDVPRQFWDPKHPRMREFYEAQGLKPR